MNEVKFKPEFLEKGLVRCRKYRYGRVMLGLFLVMWIFALSPIGVTGAYLCGVTFGIWATLMITVRPRVEPPKYGWDRPDGWLRKGEK